MHKVKKPFAWYGGKEALASTLVSLLPVHKVYVEPFAGSAALLFAKELSSIEVINDLDSGVVNFMRVLRDPVQSAELHYRLTLTPYAREEYYACLEHWDEESDPVEKARQWFTGVMQSMNSSIRNTGWSATKTPGSNPARAWRSSIANIPACVQRLAYVQIDHRDFEQVIQAYDGLHTCFYLDPPYLAQTRRKQRCYHHEMSEADHRRLLTLILHVKGMVLLSGYPHPLYKEALASWECLTFTLSCSSAVRAYAHTPKNKIGPEQLTRTECVWMNPACVKSQRQLTLFRDLQGIVEADEHEEVS